MICQTVKKDIHAHVNTFRSGLEHSRDIINILPLDEGVMVERGGKLSPETKSRVIIFSQSVLITLTPSSKGSMFFNYTECLMIQVCIMLLGQLLKK